MILRYKYRVLWILLAILLASGLWLLRIELTYERNVKHIPAGFRERPRETIYLWKA